MLFYIQTAYDDVHGVSDVIRDCTQFETDGYTPIDIVPPLPLNLLGGYYRLINGKIVYDAELKAIVDEEQKRYDKEEFDALKQEVENLKTQVEKLTSKK